MEKHSRTIFKTLSWRIVATCTTLLLVYIFTKNIFLSAGVSIAEIVVKTIIYYGNERLWNRTNFGIIKIKSPTLKSQDYTDCPTIISDKQTKNNV